MSSKYFVQLSLGKKMYRAKVSTIGCEDAADFIEAIRASPQLPIGARIISLFDADGTTEIDPMTPIADVYTTKGKPLIVKVEPAPLLNISTRGRRDYNHSKAFHSARSFLTSIALNLEAMYELDKRDPDKPATFGDVLWNKKYRTPTQKLSNAKPFNQLFSENKWDYLQALNDQVNNTLHLQLDEESMEVVLPADFIAFHKMTRAIAKEAGVVEAEADLRVKDELSESGGDTSPEVE